MVTAIACLCFFWLGRLSARPRRMFQPTIDVDEPARRPELRARLRATERPRPNPSHSVPETSGPEAAILFGRGRHKKGPS